MGGPDTKVKATRRTTAGGPHRCACCAGVRAAAIALLIVVVWLPTLAAAVLLMPRPGAQDLGVARMVGCAVLYPCALLLAALARPLQLAPVRAVGHGGSLPAPPTSPRIFERHPRALLAAFLGCTTLLLTLVLDVAVTMSRHRQNERARDPQAVSAVEKSYRIKSAVYHHDLAPGVDIPNAQWGGEYVVRTNSLGFKDTTARQVPLQGGRRILFLGDSFTEGIGVEYPHTFVGLAAAQWAATGVEVLNAGVSSYSPVIHLAKVRHLLDTVGLSFQHVVVYLDLSDPQDEAWYYQMDAQGHVVDRQGASPNAMLTLSNHLGMPGWLWLVDSHTALLRSLVYSFTSGTWGFHGRDPVGLVANLDRAAWTVDLAPWEAFGQLGLESMTRHLDQLDQLLKAYDIGLTVAVYPWPLQVMRDTVESLQVRHWRAWCANHHAGFISHFPDFLDPPDHRATVEQYYIPGDVHWNRAGHQAVARRLLHDFRWDNP